MKFLFSNILILLFCFCINLQAAEIAEETSDAKFCSEIRAQDKSLTPLITKDLLFFSQILDERASLAETYSEFTRAERQFLEIAMKSLAIRFSTWKLDNVELNSAFTDLFIDFIVMSRFFDPQAEFLLSFEKSVQKRTNIFRQLVKSGKLPQNIALAPISKNPQAADFARLYSVLYAPDLSSRHGQLKALVWQNCLRTDSKLKEAWDKMWLYSSIIWNTNSDSGWRKVFEASTTIPLARMQDLTSEANIAKFSNRWKNLSHPKPKMKGDKATQDPLPYLPYKFNDLAEILLPFGANISGSDLLAFLNTDEKSLARLEMRVRSNVFMAGVLSGMEVWKQNQATKGNFAGLLSGENSKEFQSLNKHLVLSLWLKSSAFPEMKKPDDKEKSTSKVPVNAQERTTLYLENAQKMYKEYATFLHNKLGKINSDARVQKLYKNAIPGLEKWRDVFFELAKLEVQSEFDGIKISKLPDNLIDVDNVMRHIKTSPENWIIMSVKQADQSNDARAYVGGSYWQCQKKEIKIKEEPKPDENKEEKSEAGEGDMLPALVPLVDSNPENESEALEEIEKTLFLLIPSLRYGEALFNIDDNGEVLTDKEQLVSPSDF